MRKYNLPAYPIELRYPLSSRVRSKSHCAIGTTYAIPTCSASCANEQGIRMEMSNRLNVPIPVALMASSKLAGLHSETLGHITRRILFENNVKYNNSAWNDTSQQFVCNANVKNRL